MKPCPRIGVNTGWPCQWRCVHCFYVRNPNLHKQMHRPLSELKYEIDLGKSRGFDHVVLIGYGEPMLYPHVGELIAYCTAVGMASSIITNGMAPIAKYAELFELHGLDHLHISTHGMGESMEQITGSKVADARQCELKGWLMEKGYPYRVNVTLQRLNYRQLSELAKREADFGCRHFVFLGMLPHYEWAGHVQEVAVPYAELQPEIEAATMPLRAAQVPFSIKYHPLCQLDASLWPFVMNARYANMDAWEWDYTANIKNCALAWAKSVELGDSVVWPNCRPCSAYRHCGGVNARMVAAFGEGCVRHIASAPAQYASVWDKDGGVFDLDPFHSESGMLRRKQ